MSTTWMKTIGAGAALALGVASSASAATLDLTSVASSGTINGAIFTTPDVIVSGTGLIDSFVRIQGNGTESGYNTDGTPEFDTKAGTFTHSIQLSDLQTNIVNVGGIDYYEFVLDINQTAPGSLLSLHELEIYIADVGDIDDYAGVLTSETLVYDLDGAPDGDSTIELDYNNFPGSGRLDMYALIPTSLFGNDLDQFVYLYSAFGIPNPSNDGFEEWARKEVGTFTPPPGPVPLPAAAWMGLSLLGGMGVAKKIRRSRLA